MDKQTEQIKQQNMIPITFDHYNRVMCLDLEERGVVITALFEHYADGAINPDGDCIDMSRETWLVLDAIIGQIDRYLAVSKIRSKAGKLGGIKSGESRRKAKAKQIEPKGSDIEPRKRGRPPKKINQ